MKGRENRVKIKTFTIARRRGCERDARCEMRGACIYLIMVHGQYKDKIRKQARLLKALKGM